MGQLIAMLHQYSRFLCQMADGKLEKQKSTTIFSYFAPGLSLKRQNLLIHLKPTGPSTCSAHPDQNNYDMKDDKARK